MRKIDHIIIDQRASIKEVVKRIDSGKLGIALIVDRTRNLKGIVTDVDIRKGILRGIPLHKEVCQIMNTQPITVVEGAAEAEILALMKTHNVRQIPVVDTRGHAVGLEFMGDYFRQVSRRDNYVIIMAGGLGKRLYPLTKVTPKPMLLVGNKPILENILLSFTHYGFSRFVFSINDTQKSIQQYFGDGKKWGVDISYVMEKKPLGTAGALSLIKKSSLKKPFFVANADLLTSVNFGHMLDYHLKHEYTVTVGIKDYGVDIPYGIVKLKEGFLDSFEEKPTAQFYINAGVYVLSPGITAFLKENESLDMTVFLESLKKRGVPIACFPIHEYWLDIGQMENYKKAQKDFGKVFK